MTEQLALPLPYSTAMGVDDFLVTESNRDAVSWIDKWPDWPIKGLIVLGPASSGKTHISNLWNSKVSGRVLDRQDLLSRSSLDLMDKASSFVIDDADAYAGDAEAEEALFHLYNNVVNGKGWLLLTMSKGAGQAGFVLPDLRSRLLALPVVSLSNPDDRLLEALIIKQFRDRQIEVDIGVVGWLATRAPRDAAGISDLISRLDETSLAMGGKITIALARKVMEGLNEE